MASIVKAARAWLARWRISPKALLLALVSFYPLQRGLRWFGEWLRDLVLDRLFGDRAYTWLVAHVPSGPVVMKSLRWLLEHWYQITSWVFLGSLIWLGVHAIWQTRRERALKIIRETRAIPEQDRGIFDYGAGIEESLTETTRISRQIRPLIQQLGASADEFSAARAKAEAKSASFGHMRVLAAKTAGDFDQITAKLEPLASEYEDASALLRVSWGGLLGLLNSPLADAIHAGMAKGLIESLEVSLPQISSFRSAIHSVYDKRLSQRLNESLIRLLLVVDRIILVMREILDSAYGVRGRVS